MRYKQRGTEASRRKMRAIFETALRIAKKDKRMPKVDKLEITGSKGERLFYWPHAICIPGEKPLVLQHGKVKELIGSSPLSLDGPTVVLRTTARCSGPDAKPLLEIASKK